MNRFLIIVSIFYQTACSHYSLAQQITIHKYSIKDGLVNNDVLNIRQDSRGFIWLCTRGGLSRYDGTRFTNYTTDNGLTHDMINDIVEIAPQKFIVAQNLEGPRLMEHDHIGPFTSPGKLTLNRFYKLDGNRLLAATDRHGMVEWKNNDFHYLDAGYTRNIDGITVLNDSIWVVVQYNTSVQLMTNQLHPFTALNVINVTAVYTDSQQRIWLGTTTGLRLLARRQQRNKPVAFEAALPPAFDLPVVKNTWISGFLEDSNGNYWIATGGGGVARIRGNGKSTIYTEEDGLPASYINCIWEDQQKNIWVGTPLGLAKFSMGNEVKVFTAKHGLSRIGTGSVLPMPANRIRLFSPENITELDLQTNQFSNILSNNNNNPTARLFKLNNDEVLRTSNRENKLYVSKEGNGEKIQWPGIPLNTVTRIDSERFAGSGINGTVFISKGKIQGKLALPPDIIVYVMQPDSNNSIWVGSVESGLYKIKWRSDKDSISSVVSDSLTYALPDKHVRSLFKDKGNELWIGTRYKGLVRLLEHSNGKRELQYYNTAQGLSSNFARTINRDRKGNIWVGTSQGLDKLIPSGDGYRIFNFGKINNIYSSVSRICLLENDYFVTEGQVLVHARDLQQDTLPPPPVYITKISTGAVNNDSAVREPLTTLSYLQPQIYFEFCAPQSISEEWNEYKYRLQGSADTGWTRAPVSKSVYFASLQPGNYTFEVKVLGLNGVWGEPARHQFIVNTPFWQKAWFLALIVAVVVMMVYGLYRYRIRQLVRLQQVRNQIAADLHDEIGSNLTNISILSSLGKRNIAKPQQAVDFLQRISEEVAASSQSLDDIIWSVNTSHDTLEETVARMRLYTAELFDGAGIHYELRLDPAFEAIRLIMEQRRDIYMIYKEAVNNILKHSRAKEVIIAIAIAHHQLVLSIKDDGVGFDPDKISHRHGLESIKTRVKRWNGELKVDTAINKGSSLYIALPLVN